MKLISTQTEKYFNFSNYLITASILSLCSRFELLSFIRVGDLLLGLGVIIFIVQVIRGKRIENSKLSFLVLLLLFSFVISVILGGPIALILKILFFKNFVHDFIAISISLIVAYFYVTEPDNDFSESIKLLAFYFIIIICSVLFIKLIGKSDEFTYFEGTSLRFCFMSKNPNQFALLMLPAPFVYFYHIKKNRSIYIKIFYSLCLILSVYVGSTTKSDALIIAWGVAFLFFLAQFFYYADIKRRTFLLISITIVGTLAFVINLISLEKITYYIESISISSLQGSDRINLWMNAIKATVYSPIWGLGPGSYSGVVKPFQQREAHNIILDILMYGGLLNLTVFILLLSEVIKNLIKKHVYIMLYMVVAIIVFSFFHFILRQPYFLVIIFMGYKIANIEGNVKQTQ